MDTLNQIVDLLSKPIVWKVIGAILLYYAISAKIGTMKMPTEKSSDSYRQWFRFLNRFAANLNRAAAAVHLPQADDEPKESTTKKEIE